jgi:16S rRNA (guanine527-N7)-methyltransferase
VGGWFYAYKAGRAVPEINTSLTARDLLGGDRAVEVRPVCKDQISEYDHNIMVVRKIRITPKMYPRKAGTPKKVPL